MLEHSLTHLTPLDVKQSTLKTLYSPSDSALTSKEMPLKRSTYVELTWPVPLSSHWRSAFNAYNLTRRRVLSLIVTITTFNNQFIYIYKLERKRFFSSFASTMTTIRLEGDFGGASSKQSSKKTFFFLTCIYI